MSLLNKTISRRKYPTYTYFRLSDVTHRGKNFYLRKQCNTYID